MLMGKLTLLDTESMMYFQKVNTIQVQYPNKLLLLLWSDT